MSKSDDKYWALYTTYIQLPSMHQSIEDMRGLQYLMHLIPVYSPVWSVIKASSLLKSTLVGVAID